MHPSFSTQNVIAEAALLLTFIQAYVVYFCNLNLAELLERIL